MSPAIRSPRPCRGCPEGGPWGWGVAAAPGVLGLNPSHTHLAAGQPPRNPQPGANCYCESQAPRVGVTETAAAIPWADTPPPVPTRSWLMTGCGAGAGRLRRVSTLRGRGRGAAPGKSPGGSRSGRPASPRQAGPACSPQREAGGGGVSGSGRGLLWRVPSLPETWQDRLGDRDESGGWVLPGTPGLLACCLSHAGTHPQGQHRAGPEQSS